MVRPWRQALNFCFSFPVSADLKTQNRKSCFELQSFQRTTSLLAEKCLEQDVSKIQEITAVSKLEQPEFYMFLFNILLIFKTWLWPYCVYQISIFYLSVNRQIWSTGCSKWCGTFLRIQSCTTQLEHPVCRASIILLVYY